MVDKDEYLRLVKKFALLLDHPENMKYWVGNRQLDYLTLQLHAVVGVPIREVPESDPHHIVFVYEELTVRLAGCQIDALMELKEFLEANNYPVLLSPFPGEVLFVIRGPTFDLTIIID